MSRGIVFLTVHVKGVVAEHVNAKLQLGVVANIVNVSLIQNVAQPGRAGRATLVSMVRFHPFMLGENPNPHHNN